MNNIKIPSYEEYQKKIEGLKTPEDVAMFTREFTAQAMGALPPRRGRRRKIETIVEQETSEGKRYDTTANDMEEKVVALYAKGLTTRDIVNYLREHHNVELSQSAISGITDKVYPSIKEWQTRPLSSLYPFIYLDGLRFKVREAGKIVNKCAYIILGLNEQGHKDVLGIWIAETESAKFWMGILNELKNRGVDDILIACIDGLRGFPEAIKAIYPDAEIQHCIVHQVRHTTKFVPHKDREQFCDDLKSIYTAPTEEAGRDALEQLKGKWPSYHPYLKSWEDKWASLAPFFRYPQPIRRSMYTTNAIESLNHQFRKVTKTTTIFPHDESLLKLLWLAQDDISKSWTKPVIRWGEIITQLAILFPEKIEL
jgi:transposase-like protein